LETQSDPQVVKLGVSNHAWQLRPFEQFHDAYRVGRYGLKLCGRKMDYRVSQQLAFPLQLFPLKFVTETFGANFSRRPDDSVATIASYGH
jgi:hypothetical protein